MTFFDLQFSCWMNTENPWKMHATVNFPNGYGASVIFGPYTFGSDLGLFEVAVMKDGNPCYTSGLTEDVIGYLEPDEVTELLQKIERLPPAL